MECMINSDNVVRGGLTPKLKDKDTLCQILPYSARLEPKVLQGDSMFSDENFEIQEFFTSAFPELRLLRLNTKKRDQSEAVTAWIPSLPFLSIMIVMKGKASVQV